MYDTLLQLLIEGNLLSEQQADTARRRAERTGQRLETAILELELCDEAALYRVLARCVAMPLVDLEKNPPAPGAAAGVPAKIAMEFHCLPLLDQGGVLTLAVPNPLTGAAVDQLRLLLGRRFTLLLAMPSQLDRHLRNTYGLGMGSIIEARQKNADDATVTRLVDEILREAANHRATDIHIEPYGETMRLRFRVDGMLRTVPTPPGMASYADSIISRIKVMAQLNIAERRLPHDGRMKVQVNGTETDFRVSVLPTHFGESLCLRMLHSEQLNMPLQQLGLDEHQMAMLLRQSNMPNGMMLITGPTGSGKTTTLYSVLSYLHNLHQELKIVTVEDPVEYELAGITQLQTHAEIGLTFDSALRSILRHDPDVIFIGEIRDRETAEMAVQSAMTGHLVLSTLHTNDSISAVSRLLSMGMEAELVASSLNCVIAQRLVRTICPRCAQEAAPLPPELQTELEAACAAAGIPVPPALMCAAPGGCPACDGTGYSGRTAIYEFFPVDEELEDMIAAARPNGELRAAARRKGLSSLRNQAWLKVAAGITSAEELLRVTSAKHA